MAYTTILVGTDGSVTAARAVERALELADPLGAKVVILQVVSPHASEDSQESVARSLEERFGGRGNVKSVVRSGDPAGVLVRVAAEESAELIVVGSQGMELSQRVLDEATELLDGLSRVPNRLSHNAATDVLIVQTD